MAYRAVDYSHRSASDLPEYSHDYVAYPLIEGKLYNLRPGTLYEVTVNAQSNIGQGPSSPPADVFLGEAGKAVSLCTRWHLHAMIVLIFWLLH